MTDLTNGDKSNGFCEGETFKCDDCKKYILITSTDILRGDRHDCIICQNVLCENCCRYDCIFCGESELCKKCVYACVNCGCQICKSEDCLSEVKKCNICKKHYCNECNHQCD